MPHSASANGISHRRNRSAPPARTTAGRWGAASIATTASSAATPTSTTPTWCSTTIRSSRRRRPEEGYHLTVDLADKAIEFIADLKQVAPEKPFFLYFATGANHAPHHVPKEWADKYKGKFDDGWDAYREKVFARQKELGIVAKDAVLSRHDPDVQQWDELPDDERRLYARMMEVFAGFFEYTDHQIGRLLDFLENTGQLDNTLIMVISDNGASAEGGPSGSVDKHCQCLPSLCNDNFSQGLPAKRLEYFTYSRSKQQGNVVSMRV